MSNLFKDKSEMPDNFGGRRRDESNMPMATTAPFSEPPLPQVVRTAQTMAERSAYEYRDAMDVRHVGRPRFGYRV